MCWHLGCIASCSAWSGSSVINAKWPRNGGYTCHLHRNLFNKWNLEQDKRLKIKNEPLHKLCDSTLVYIYNTNRNPRWERWVFARFVFSLFFHSQLSKCPKTQGKPKKTKKTILWEESWVSPCKIVFFFFVFLEVFFTLPSPIVQKLEENQKNQKNQSCEKNLG